MNSEFRIATKWPYNWSAGLIFGATGTAGRVLGPSLAEDPPEIGPKSELRADNEPLRRESRAEGSRTNKAQIGLRETH